MDEKIKFKTRGRSWDGQLWIGMDYLSSELKERPKTSTPYTLEYESAYNIKTIESLTKQVDESKTKLQNLYAIVDKVQKENKQLMTEITDLSGSVFEEAHKIIGQVNTEKKMAEVKLNASKESEEVLKLQNDELKQIIEKNSETKQFKKFDLKKLKLKKNVKKVANMNMEGNEYNYCAESTLSVLSIFIIEYELNELYYDEFIKWLNSGCPRDSAFLNRILIEETYPCLTFVNPDLQKETREFIAIRMGIPTIKQAKRADKPCEFMFILSQQYYDVSFDTERKYVACSLVRNMLISISNLYNYINYITQGLVKSPREKMFQKIQRLRLYVGMSRLGFSHYSP
ncbi:hypothetical protein HZS_4360 [Henneguya salminicola]|nr:hypothetical protein HZS_4360 [Henneguya salminicola]